MSISGKNPEKKNNAGFDGFLIIPEIGHITAKSAGYRLFQPLFLPYLLISEANPMSQKKSFATLAVTE
jgi:hypothetical protein